MARKRIRKNKMKAEEIKWFLNKRYKIRQPEQEAVVESLVDFSNDTGVHFTMKGLKHLMEPIRSEKLIRDLDKESIVVALDRILSEFRENRSCQTSFGNITIKAITSEIGCPKPWC